MNINKLLITILFCASGTFITSPSLANTQKTVEFCEQKHPRNSALSACLDQVRYLVEKELATWINNQTFILEKLKKVTGRGAALKIFKRSQALFEKYREDNCRWQYLQISPATGADSAYKKCYIHLTKNRISELASLNK